MKKSIATNTDRLPDTTRAVGFPEILGKYRADSLSEAEKGTKFEELMRTYLLNLPKYKGMFEKVWLWRNFPFRTDFGSGHDLGIDLVALTVSGEYWAVQCKCYQDDAYITKEAVEGGEKPRLIFAQPEALPEAQKAIGTTKPSA